jgi:N utilization substance protein A
VAVASKDRDVDPVGACVGMKGSRVQAVIRELRGEKIDIVQWDDDPSHYVRNALNPASINRVAVRDYETRDMEVIVAEDQLSLAIGKRGQNVRLAAKLVGWNLDIKSEAEKKAEVEIEIQRMQEASVELASLPGISQGTADLLLDAGFRTAEEVSAASMDDLTAIGIPEELALDLHDAAEEWLEEQQRLADAAPPVADDEGGNEAGDAAATPAEEANDEPAETTGSSEDRAAGDEEIPKA